MLYYYIAKNNDGKKKLMLCSNIGGIYKVEILSTIVCFSRVILKKDCQTTKFNSLPNFCRSIL